MSTAAHRAEAALRLRRRDRSAILAGNRPCCEGLEPRRLLTVNVLVHHNDGFNDGANAAETALTPVNVNPTSFGRKFVTALDGQSFAQPLYVQSENITAGSSPGVHSVAYVVTMHDSLYAIDANTGTVLWQDSFLNTSDPTNYHTPTTGVTTISTSTAMPGFTGVGPELGILATPAIDLGLPTPMLFLNAATTEGTGDNTHYIQRLWKVNISSGQATSTVIADTILPAATNPKNYAGYQYVAGPIVNGTGNNAPSGPNPTYPNRDGWVAAPGGKTGYVIAYNALLQMQRTAVTLLNGNVYLASASHGDQGPYYGWVLGYSESDLHLTAAFNTAPTYEGIFGQTPYSAQAGVWMSGSAIATDGKNLYLTTGNGTFNPAPSNFNAQGFPIDHNYGDALLKLTPDTTSTSSAQNGNGWGLKVSDYFTPSNQDALNKADLDLGSSGVTLLPSTLHDSAGNPMLVIGGKESRFYLIDINNLGKFNYTYPATGNPDPLLYDRVLGELPLHATNADGHNIFSSAAYYNGKIYVSDNGDPARAFNPTSLITGTVPPITAPAPTGLQTTALTFNYPGPTFSISSNGTTNGIAWAINTKPTNSLLAFDASNITTPIYNSATNASRDNLTGGDVNAVVRQFSVPTVANGMVYITTGSGQVIRQGAFVGYGLLPSYLASNAGYFGAPSKLAVANVSATDTRLTWQNNASAAGLVAVERSTDGTHWTILSYVDPKTTSFDDRSFTGSSTQYYYRVVAISGANSSIASNTASFKAAISGTVFNDVNNNAISDAGEPGLNGWRVFVDSNQDGIFQTTEPNVLTDTSGNYTLAGLAPGAYIVRALRTVGWAQTAPASFFGRHVTVTNGQTVSGILFGEVATSLSFTKLPSAQGFKYVVGGNTATEQQVFSVNGTTLHQTTKGLGFPSSGGGNNYTMANVVDPTQGFTLTIRARVTAYEQDPNNTNVKFGFFFEVQDGHNAYAIALTPNTIQDLNLAILSTSIDCTVYHTFTLTVATPGGIAKLFVDSTLVGSTAPVTRQVNNLALGDGTGQANAAVNITAFQFQQPASPPVSVVVNTTADVTDPAGSSIVSLRDAVAIADASIVPVNITFDSSVFAASKVITLASTLVLTNKNVATTITGPSAGVQLSGGDTGNVFNVGTGVTAGFSNLTISHGFDGGTLTNLGTLTLTGCTVSNNTQVHNALEAPISNAASLTVTNCTITNNAGGGIYNQKNGNLIVNGTNISHNSDVGIYNVGTATIGTSTISFNTRSGSGAGIANTGTLTLNSSTVSNNTASSTGGGIYNLAILAVNNSTFASNSASSGGAIYSKNLGSAVSSATITTSTFSNNTASSAGGAIDAVSGKLSITGCTFSTNGATSGGGIYNSATATLANTTLAGNNADNGGGVYNASTATLVNTTLAGNNAGTGGGAIFNAAAATLTIQDSTLSGNEAVSEGGGVDNANSDNPGTVTVSNTIIAGNTTDGGFSAPGYDFDGIANSLGHNLIGSIDFSDGWDETDLTGTQTKPLDPGLSALGNNGGPTQTMAPKAGSPALGNGSVALIPPGITTDQRGNARVVAGKVDIGAVEV